MIRPATAADYRGLARVPSRRFHQHLGGELIRAQPITIFGAELEEVAYGWGDTASLRR